MAVSVMGVGKRTKRKWKSECVFLNDMKMKRGLDLNQVIIIRRVCFLGSSHLFVRWFVWA